ncbi:phosphotransferase [Staphylococcus sp. MI 10-1553]|uniref:phosphotransferase n=1 Tax=Staphylococcus sp. MI 10-1553 TaxID=1912064 RepID=UPI001EF0A8F3|nr:phosphotransferase [Staphylococcus sp. MI 10-1553]
MKVREGRNINKKIEKGGENFFKKTIVGPKSDAQRRFDNCLKWEKLHKNLPKINSPELLDYDKNELDLYFEWLEGGISLEDFLLEKSDCLENKIKIASNALAIIHTTNNWIVDVDKEKSLPNRRSLMIAINKYDYASCTGAELELFALLHQDKKFIESLFDENDENNENDECLCHGDVRLDQFIWYQNKMYIIDFEELRIGDGTRDLAGIIGSIYFNCLLKTFSKTTQETSDEKEIESQFVERGMAYIEEMIPIMKSAYEAYSIVKPINKINLSINIGWFIIERIMSRAKYSFKLSATDKAILGIGREIILSPNKFEEIFK